MGASAPQPDWTKLQEGIGTASKTQLQNNRPDLSTPFASQTWDGNKLSQGFSGLPMNQAATGLQSQVGLLGQPMDWGQFGQAGTGDQARQQATTASYDQATSRLNPQWDQREEQARTKLMNQGLDPSSAAFRSEMGQMGLQRNDAYSSAMNNAQMMGQSAGDSVFRNNAMARQSAIADALRQRGMPMQELQQLQGFLGGMPGFNQDNSTLQGALGSSNFANQAYQQQQAAADAANAAAAQGVGGGASLVGAFASLLPILLGSDERMKQDIERTGTTVRPGVELVTWRYKDEYGDSSQRHTGVIAQELEKVAPQYVHERNGLKYVDYSFLSEVPNAD